MLTAINLFHHQISSVTNKRSLPTLVLTSFALDYNKTPHTVELAWRSGSVMDCHAMARG